MKTLCLLQARLGSTRLPRKVLADIDGEPMLVRIIRRLSRSSSIDRIVIATTWNKEDDAIAATAATAGADVFRGSEPDVLKRLAGALDSFPADMVIHATGDNPLVEPSFIDRLVKEMTISPADFAFTGGIPIGTGADVYKADTLRLLDRIATTPAHREHVNAGIFDRLDIFNILNLSPPCALHRPELRLTVDTPEDLELIRRIALRLHRPTELIDLNDVVRLTEDEPDLFAATTITSQHYVSDTARRMRQSA